MKLSRRKFLRLAGSAAAVPSVSRIARAQTYPARPVRIVVGFAAGGPQDIVARLIGQALSERLGQQFVVENRLGAAGNIATEAVVRAPADGYTVLMIGPSATINVSLYQKLNFDLLRDVAPVASIMRTSNVLEVHPSVPVHSVAEFIAYAKARPGQINMGSGGAGSSLHMSGELFKMMAGVDLLHVPYRGSAPALTDLLAGQIQVMFDNMASSVEHVRTGKLRGLGVTTAARSQSLPDLPPIADVVPGYESSGFYGLGAPRNTPAEIIGKINEHINAVIGEPRMAARLVDLGGTVVGGSPADFGNFIADEAGKWAKVIKFANIKPE